MLPRKLHVGSADGSGSGSGDIQHEVLTRRKAPRRKGRGFLHGAMIVLLMVLAVGGLTAIFLHRKRTSGTRLDIHLNTLSSVRPSSRVGTTAGNGKPVSPSEGNPVASSAASQASLQHRKGQKHQKPQHRKADTNAERALPDTDQATAGLQIYWELRPTLDHYHGLDMAPQAVASSKRTWKAIIHRLKQELAVSVSGENGQPSCQDVEPTSNTHAPRSIWLVTENSSTSKGSHVEIGNLSELQCLQGVLFPVWRLCRYSTERCNVFLEKRALLKAVGFRCFSFLSVLYRSTTVRSFQPCDEKDLVVVSLVVGTGREKKTERLPADVEHCPGALHCALKPHGVGHKFSSGSLSSSNDELPSQAHPSLLFSVPIPLPNEQEAFSRSVHQLPHSRRDIRGGNKKKTKLRQPKKVSELFQVVVDSQQYPPEVIQKIFSAFRLQLGEAYAADFPPAEVQDALEQIQAQNEGVPIRSSSSTANNERGDVGDEESPMRTLIDFFAAHRYFIVSYSSLLVSLSCFLGANGGEGSTGTLLVILSTPGMTYQQHITVERMLQVCHKQSDFQWLWFRVENDARFPNPNPSPPAFNSKRTTKQREGSSPASIATVTPKDFTELAIEVGLALHLPAAPPSPSHPPARMECSDSREDSQGVGVSGANQNHSPGTSRQPHAPPHQQQQLCLFSRRTRYDPDLFALQVDRFWVEGAEIGLPVDEKVQFYNCSSTTVTVGASGWDCRCSRTALGRTVSLQKVWDRLAPSPPLVAGGKTGAVSSSNKERKKKRLQEYDTIRTDFIAENSETPRELVGRDLLTSSVGKGTRGDGEEVSPSSSSVSPVKQQRPLTGQEEVVFVHYPWVRDNLYHIHNDNIFPLVLAQQMLKHSVCGKKRNITSDDKTSDNTTLLLLPSSRTNPVLSAFAETAQALFSRVLALRDGTARKKTTDSKKKAKPDQSTTGGIVAAVDRYSSSSSSGEGGGGTMVWGRPKRPFSASYDAVEPYQRFQVVNRVRTAVLQHSKHVTTQHHQEGKRSKQENGTRMSTPTVVVTMLLRKQKRVLLNEGALMALLQSAVVGTQSHPQGHYCSRATAKNATTKNGKGKDNSGSSSGCKKSSLSSSVKVNVRYCCEGMSYAEQVLLMAETDILIGVHGAGLLHAIHLHPRPHRFSLNGETYQLTPLVVHVASKRLNYHEQTVIERLALLSSTGPTRDDRIRFMTTRTLTSPEDRSAAWQNDFELSAEEVLLLGTEILSRFFSGL